MVEFSHSPQSWLSVYFSLFQRFGGFEGIRVMVCVCEVRVSGSLAGCLGSFPGLSEAWCFPVQQKHSS